jgi:hypothetical protein
MDQVEAGRWARASDLRLVTHTKHERRVGAAEHGPAHRPMRSSGGLAQERHADDRRASPCVV